MWKSVELKHGCIVHGPVSHPLPLTFTVAANPALAPPLPKKYSEKAQSAWVPLSPPLLPAKSHQPQKPLAPPPPVVLLKLPEKATCQLAAPYALAAGEPMTVIPAVKTEATATTNHRRIPFALTPPS